MFVRLPCSGMIDVMNFFSRNFDSYLSFRRVNAEPRINTTNRPAADVYAAITRPGINASAEACNGTREDACASVRWLPGERVPRDTSLILPDLADACLLQRPHQPD